MVLQSFDARRFRGPDCCSFERGMPHFSAVYGVSAIDVTDQSVYQRPFYFSAMLYGGTNANVARPLAVSY